MKYTSLLSICSLLTLNTVSFSQDTVMTGMGGNSSGFGGIDVDVPEEEQQNDCPVNNDEGNQDDPIDSSENEEESTPEGSDQVVVPNQNISVFDISNSWISLAQSEKSWIYTSKTNERLKRNPRTQWDKQKPDRRRFVLRGGCPNETSQRSENGPSFDDQFRYPPSYACDCCCHLSSGDSTVLTSNSDEWDDIYDDSTSNGGLNGSSGKYGNQSDDRYDSNGKDDQNGYEDVPCGRGNDDRQSSSQGKKNDRKKIGGSCDNKDGQDKSYDEWSDDDCECSCNCKRFGEVVIYD